MTAELPVNGFDAALAVQTEPGRPMTTHHVLEHDRVLPPAAWREALRHLVMHWPALASRLRLGPSVRRVTWPLTTTALADRLEWDDDPSPAALEAWLSRPLDPEREPPFRVRLGPGPAAARAVVLTLHHALCDGVGALALFDALVRHAAGLPTRAPATAPPPASPHIDPRGVARRIAGWLRPAARLVDAVGTAATGHAVEVRTLDPATWYALGERARRLGVSRYALVCHAALHAVASAPRDHAARPLRMLSCVDLRAAHGVPGDRLQNWLGTVELELPPHALPSPAQLYAALVGARAPSMAAITPWLLGSLGRRSPATARALLRLADAERFPNPYTFMMSQLPLADGRGWPAPLHPRRLWCTSLLPRRPGLGLTVCTVSSHATVAASWPASALRRPTVAALLDRMHEALRAELARDAGHAVTSRG
jgi:hypothetical protein